MHSRQNTLVAIVLVLIIAACVVVTWHRVTDSSDKQVIAPGTSAQTVNA